MANYEFVVGNHFDPFSFQEMLLPWTMYKEAYEKSEDAYTELKSKADVFKDLSRNLPDNSEAKQIYEDYAKDLNSQAGDLARNGLNMGNRRALASLKQRYSGEIGALERAKTRRDEVLKARDALMAAGKPMLFATDTNDLSIDNFLYDRSPNMYSISTDELYARGAAAGKAASSRIFKVNGEAKTLGGHYRDFMQSVGWAPNGEQTFREMMLNNPELRQSVQATLKGRGVTANLTGEALERATEEVINGWIDGAIYTESHTPQQDLGVLTAAQAAQDARAKEQNAITQAHYIRSDANQARSLQLQADSAGMEYNNETKHFDWNPNRDREFNINYRWMYANDEDGNIDTSKLSEAGKAYRIKNNSGSGNSSSSGSSSSKASLDLEGNTVIGKDGKVKDYQKTTSNISGNENWGTNISITVAGERYPNARMTLEKRYGGRADDNTLLSDYYDFYDNGNGITVIPKAKSRWPKPPKENTTTAGSNPQKPIIQPPASLADSINNVILQ